MLHITIKIRENKYCPILFKVLYQSFYMYESVCVGTEINKPESEQARAELTNLCREVVKDGVTLLAREVATNRIVGVSFNALQVFNRNIFK